MEFDNLAEQIELTNRDLARELQRLAPVDTGRLKRSIKPQPIVDTVIGVEAPISIVSYYVFPDLGTKFQRAQRFVERAQNEVIGDELQAIANAAAEDVAIELDKTLPDTISLTIGL